MRKGYSALLHHLLGITDELRQKIRDEVLGASSADFTRFVDQLESVRDKGLVVVLGSSDAINKANEQMGGDWLKIQKVM